MPKKTQTQSRRFVNGQWITETEGKSYDADSKVAAEESTERARKAMTSGAKPAVSDEEPKDKNSLQYMAWKRRQKNRSASDGAAALASR